LVALNDGKPTSFAALLSEVRFSHNTLQRHLERLAAQGLIVRGKATANTFGRPKLAYPVPSRTTKHVTVAQDPHFDLVALPFNHLRHVCRFEKAATAKKTMCLKFAPKPPNKNHDHFTPISEQTSALIGHVVSKR
jgi:DNA-binding Lrp family transcriptional regulator